MKITKKFKFELAHRLVDSYSKKCQSFHGHSYTAEVTLKGESLDGTGMLMDFGEVKDKFSWIIDAWDHSLMLWDKDPVCQEMLSINQRIKGRFIIVDYNPTAENMAHHLYRELVKAKLPVKDVLVRETLTGWAVANKPSPLTGLRVVYHNIEEARDA